jgi:hypothetical protein
MRFALADCALAGLEDLLLAPKINPDFRNLVKLYF